MRLQRIAIATCVCFGFVLGCGGNLDRAGTDPAEGNGAPVPGDGQTMPKKPPVLEFDVASGPEIVAVNYGTNVNPALTQYEDSFYSDLVTSSYLNTLNEYGVGTYGASYRGQYTISPQNGSSWLSDDDIQNELTRDINNGWVPYPDNDTIYVFHMPPNVTTLFDNQNNRACAWHNSFQYATGGLFSYQHVNYAVMGDKTAACYGPLGAAPNGSLPTGLGYLNDATVMISHEVIEAATDADGGTNRYSCNTSSGDNEIGDCCQMSVNLGGGPLWTTFQGSSHAWFVQRPWSNFYGNCGTSVLPTPNTPSSMQSSSAAVSRSPNNLDILYPKASCSTFLFCTFNLYNDWWTPSSRWGQTYVSNTLSTPGNNAPVAAISPNSGSIYTYFFDRNGHVSSSYWTGGGWSTYEIDAGAYGSAPAGAALSAVARTSSNLDVFHVDHSGNVLQYSGRPGSTSWSTREIGIPAAAKLKDGQNLAAVARTTQNIDLFFVGGDGNLWTAWTYDAQDGTAANWGTAQLTTIGWYQVQSPIAAVARTWGNLDVYFFENNGMPTNAAWSTGASWAIFQAFYTPPPPIGANGYVSIVAVSPFNLDGFYVDSSGRLEVSYWSVGASSWNVASPGIGGSPFDATGLLGAVTQLSSTENMQVFQKASYGYYQDTWTPSGWSTSSLP